MTKRYALTSKPIDVELELARAVLYAIAGTLAAIAGAFGLGFLLASAGLA